MQCAAVRTVRELSKVPPQRGLLCPRGTSATCQGISPVWASSPPTIRVRMSFIVDTPHLYFLDVVTGIRGGLVVVVVVVVVGGLAVVVCLLEHALVRVAPSQTTLNRLAVMLKVLKSTKIGFYKK